MNKVILIGHLGRDPQTSFTPGGRQVTKFPIATNRRWTNSEGEKQEATDWHNIELWGSAAKVAAQYLKKGRKVLVEGRLQTDRYEKDGVTKYFTKVVGLLFEFQDSKRDETDVVDEEAVLEPVLSDDGIPF